MTSEYYIRLMFAHTDTYNTVYTVHAESFLAHSIDYSLSIEVDAITSVYALLLLLLVVVVQIPELTHSLCLMT